MRRRFGLRFLPKRRIDPRDHLYGDYHAPIARPGSVNWTGYEYPARDQGGTNACTGYAASAVIEAIDVRSNKNIGRRSPLFTYWTARERAGLTSKDAGAYVFDAVKSIASDGVSPDRFHPEGLGVSAKPSLWAKSFAWLLRKPLRYYKLTDANMDDSFVDETREALARGYNVIGGVKVFNALRHPINGVVGLPSPGESPRGAHCIKLIGYADLSPSDYQAALRGEIGFYAVLDNASTTPTSQGFFIVKNSWGSSYGNGGFCLIPYEYVDDHGNDFWAVTTV